jgi:hypothetical protein
MPREYSAPERCATLDEDEVPSCANVASTFPCNLPASSRPDKDL